MDKTMQKTDTWCPSGVMPAEVVFFLFKIGEALLEPSVRLYITEAVCRQMLAFHNASWTRCAHLSEYPDQEDNVQSTAANYLMYYKLIINLPALLLLLFCGAWSDHVGRKLPVILSSFGTVIAVIFFMISRVTVIVNHHSLVIMMMMMMTTTTVGSCDGHVDTVPGSGVSRSCCSRCVRQVDRHDNGNAQVSTSTAYNLSFTVSALLSLCIP